jgi:hypothetical protein
MPRNSRDSETRSKTAEERDPDAAKPDDVVPTFEPQEAKEEIIYLKRGYKSYDFMQISVIDLLKLMWIPKCCYSDYLMALDRLIRKSTNKIKREIEFNNVIKKSRDCYFLCQSFE